MGDGGSVGDGVSPSVSSVGVGPYSSGSSEGVSPGSAGVFGAPLSLSASWVALYHLSSWVYSGSPLRTSFELLATAAGKERFLVPGIDPAICVHEEPERRGVFSLILKKLAFLRKYWASAPNRFNR